MSERSIAIPQTAADIVKLIEDNSTDGKCSKSVVEAHAAHLIDQGYGSLLRVLRVLGEGQDTVWIKDYKHT